MAQLSHKIKTAMDESRMLILGAQVFLGGGGLIHLIRS